MRWGLVPKLRATKVDRAFALRPLLTCQAKTSVADQEGCSTAVDLLQIVVGNWNHSVKQSQSAELLQLYVAVSFAVRFGSFGRLSKLSNVP